MNTAFCCAVQIGIVVWIRNYLVENASSAEYRCRQALCASLFFSVLRVMVNLNQLGEAAVVASYVSLHQNAPLQDIAGTKVRTFLRDGGSAL